MDDMPEGGTPLGRVTGPKEPHVAVKTQDWSIVEIKTTRCVIRLQFVEGKMIAATQTETLNIK